MAAHRSVAKKACLSTGNRGGAEFFGGAEDAEEFPYFTFRDSALSASPRFRISSYMKLRFLRRREIRFFTLQKQIPHYIRNDTVCGLHAHRG